MSENGTLRLVATPIGNLEDLSPRARRVLETSELVCCEDTRRSGRLLAGLGIQKRLLSLHDHNERQRVPQVLEVLRRGLDVALVSDAGMPLLSDPGYPLVRAAAAEGVRVEAIPGPDAITTALVVSALPPYPFTFLGFPPPKGTKRRRGFFRRVRDLDHTLVFFESPHRIVTCLGDAREELGDRPAALCRELTKLHEEVLRGSLSEIAAALGARPSVKGEMVVVVGRPEA